MLTKRVQKMDGWNEKKVYFLLIAWRKSRYSSIKNNLNISNDRLKHGKNFIWAFATISNEMSITRCFWCDADIKSMWYSKYSQRYLTKFKERSWIKYHVPNLWVLRFHGAKCYIYLCNVIINTELNLMLFIVVDILLEWFYWLGLDIVRSSWEDTRWQAVKWHKAGL